MRLLVTGGAGYIGAHFVKMVKELGHEIAVVDNFSQGKKNMINGIEYLEVDIQDQVRLLSIFEEFKPDVVVHYAALANLEPSLRTPDIYYYNNVVGTLNVLEAMRAVGCDKIIFSSTAATYGEPVLKDGETIDENYPTIPTSPYGHSKLMVEQILKDYHRAYRIKSISFRYFCAVGVGEGLGCYHNQETQVVPCLVKGFLGKKFIVNGNDYDTPDGTPIRDYIHVNDLATAHLKALEHLDGCKVYNLGINRGYSVLELIKAAEEVVGKKLDYEIGTKRKADPTRLIGDSTKAQQELGWTPVHTDIGQVILSDYKFFNEVGNQ